MQRRLAKYFAVIASMSAAVLLLAGIALATAPGQRALLSVVARLASEPGAKITLGDLDGDLFSSARLSRITLSDAKGPWLEIEDTSFSWRPIALLAGTLDIADIAIRKASFLRKPEMPPSSDTGPSSWPPVAIRLGRGRAADVTLHEDAFGAAARVSIGANLSIAGFDQDAIGQLQARRLDSIDGHVTAAIRYNPALRSLTLDLSAGEAAGGLAATLLQFPGRPPLNAVLKGEGTLDDWRAKLAIDTGGKVFVHSGARIALGRGGYDFSARLDGYLSHLAPRGLRDLLRGRTQASLQGRWLADQKFELDAAALNSDAVSLDLKGAADLRRSHLRGEANLSLGRSDKRPVAVPLGDGTDATLTSATAKLLLGDGDASRPLSLKVNIDALVLPQGRAGHIDLLASAVQPLGNTQSWQTLNQIELTGSASDIAATDVRFSDLLSSPLTLQARGKSDVRGLVVDTFAARLGDIELSGEAALREKTLSGTFNAAMAKLSRFSGLAGQALGGKLALAGKGSIILDNGSIAAALSGTLTDPELDNAAVSRLLAGSNKLRASFSRNAAGVATIEEATITGPAIDLQMAGKVSGKNLNGQARMQLRKLSRLDPALRGGLSMTAGIKGNPEALQATLAATGEALVLRNKPVENLTLNARAAGSIGNLTGDVTLASRYAGLSAGGQLRIRQTAPGALRLDGVDVGFGKNRVKGWIALAEGTTPDADLILTAPDIAAFAVLTGVPMAGRIAAQLSRPKNVGAGQVRLTAHASGLRVASFSADDITADADVAAISGTVGGKGVIRLSGGRIDSFDIAQATLVAERSGDPLSFRLTGKSRDASLDAGGVLRSQGDAVKLTLQSLRVAAQGADARLMQPANVEMNNGQVTLDRLLLGVGTGQVSLSGEAGKSLKGAALLQNIPAAIADIAAPGLGAGGVINGRIDIGGTLDAPLVMFDSNWRNATTTALKEAGLPLMALSAKGRLAGSTLDGNAQVTGNGGLKILGSGSMPLGATHGMSFRATGQVPMALLNVALAERGSRLDGIMDIDVTATGDPASPRLSGIAAVAGGSVRDPATGVHLKDMSLSARITSNAIIIERLDGGAPAGGRITASGQISLDHKAGLPSDLRVNAQRLKIDNRETLNGTISGNLSLTGPLLASPLVSGNVTLVRVNVTIPERLPRSITDLDIEHKNLLPVQRRALGLKVATDTNVPDHPVRLDVTLLSKNRIFVRGRGLDARLGGQLRLSGNSDALIAEGEFKMLRGRIAIVGRRLNFNSGTIGFVGNLDPLLDFEATTDADGSTITTTVSGRASNPGVRFSSSPELPEDEVLARLLFNKSLAKLSPLQIAQLATEIDRLGGLSSGPGISEQLRKTIGVDTLDVTTDKTGHTAVSAGSYIGDKLYVGVQQNTGTNASSVVIDLDITKNIKARGQTGSDGTSKLGIGVEWNY